MTNNPQQMNDILQTLRARGRHVLMADPQYLLQTEGGPVERRCLVLADIIGDDDQVLQEHVWDQVRLAWRVALHRRPSVLAYDDDPTLANLRTVDYVLQSGSVSMLVDAYLLPAEWRQFAEPTTGLVPVIFVTYRRTRPA